MAQDPTDRPGGQGEGPGEPARLDALPTPRRIRFRWIWWTTFFAFAAVGTLWNIAQPQWTGPDERAHFIEAQAVWTGQILPAQDPDTPSQIAVGVLHGITNPIEGYRCVIGHPDTSADCAPATRMSRKQGGSLDYVSREPPLPTFLNGWPIAIQPSVLTLYLGRAMDTILGAAALATAIALAATRRRPFLLVGVVVATTPSAIAGFGVLGSSQLEIGASVVVWTAAVLLIDGEPLTRSFLATIGAFATVLVLSRPLSFVYLALAVLAVLLLSRRSQLIAVVQSRTARNIGVVVMAATVLSVFWAAFLEAPHGNFMQHSHVALLHGIGEKVNFYLSTVQNHWVQSIGAIGANEYNGPWWTTLGWSFLIAAVVGAGLLWAGRRRVLVVVLLGVALLAVPLVVEVSSANTERLQWQGRYDLPTMAGIILVSCGVLDRAMVATPQLRRLATASISLAGLLQVFEFVGSLRRYAVGIDGPLDPANWSEGWHPPLALDALLVLGVLAVIAAYALLGLHQRSILRLVPSRPGGSAGPNGVSPASGRAPQARASSQSQRGPTRPVQPL